MSLEFFTKRYEAQIDRSKQFTSQVGNIITWLTLLAALLGYLITESKVSGTVGLGLFWSFMLISILLSVCSISCVFRIFFASRLEDLAPSSQWFEHLLALEHKHGTAVSAVKEEFEKDLMEHYAEAAGRNQSVNDQVGYALEQARFFLIGSLCFVLLSSLIFFSFYFG